MRDKASGTSPSCPPTGMNCLAAMWDKPPQDAQQENMRGLLHCATCPGWNCGWHWPWSSHPQQTQPAPRGKRSPGLTPWPHTAWNLIMLSIKELLEDNPPEWHLPCGLLLPGWENCPSFFTNKSEGKPVLSRQHSLGAAEDFAGVAMNNSLSTEFRSK